MEGSGDGKPPTKRLAAEESREMKGVGTGEMKSGARGCLN